MRNNLRLTVTGSQLSFDKVTHYLNEHAPFYVLFFISFGGLLAFAMEMAGNILRFIYSLIFKTQSVVKYEGILDI